MIHDFNFRLWHLGIYHLDCDFDIFYTIFEDGVYAAGLFLPEGEGGIMQSQSQGQIVLIDFCVYFVIANHTRDYVFHRFVSFALNLQQFTTVFVIEYYTCILDNLVSMVVGIFCSSNFPGFVVGSWACFNFIPLNLPKFLVQDHVVE